MLSLPSSAAHHGLGAPDHKRRARPERRRGACARQLSTAAGAANRRTRVRARVTAVYRSARFSSCCPFPKPQGQNHGNLSKLRPLAFVNGTGVGRFKSWQTIEGHTLGGGTGAGKDRDQPPFSDPDHAEIAVEHPKAGIIAKHHEGHTRERGPQQAPAPRPLEAPRLPEH